MAVHIPGGLNIVADAISRDNLPPIFSKVPDVSPHPVPLPRALVELLVTEQPDWTLPSWGRLFQELFAAGLAPSTQKAYKSGERRYCSSAGQSPYPVTEQGLSAFVAFLYRQGLSAATMKNYLAAVRHGQI